MNHKMYVAAVHVLTTVTLLTCVSGDPRVYELVCGSRVNAQELRSLLKAGAKPDEYRSLWGFNALIRGADNGHAGAVALLLEHGADANARNAYDSTALIKASRNGHVAVVRALLAHGADVDARDSFGTTALHKATSGRHHATMEELLRHGADAAAANALGLTAARLARGVFTTDTVALRLLEKLGPSDASGGDGGAAGEL